MDPVDGLADRYGFLVTLLLTAVAFQFVLSAEMPNVPYLTVLDKYIICSFCYLFILMIMMAIIPSVGDRYNHEPGEDDIITKVDNICFITALIILFVYHFYVLILVFIARKKEKPKVSMDKWAIEKAEEEDDDDDDDVPDALNLTCSESARLAPEIWEQYVDPKKYNEFCKKRQY